MKWKVQNIHTGAADFAEGEKLKRESNILKNVNMKKVKVQMKWKVQNTHAGASRTSANFIQPNDPIVDAFSQIQMQLQIQMQI